MADILRHLALILPNIPANQFCFNVRSTDRFQRVREEAFDLFQQNDTLFIPAGFGAIIGVLNAYDRNENDVIDDYDVAMLLEIYNTNEARPHRLLGIFPILWRRNPPEDCDSMDMVSDSDDEGSDNDNSDDSEGSNRDFRKSPWKMIIRPYNLSNGKLYEAPEGVGQNFSVSVQICLKQFLDDEFPVMRRLKVSKTAIKYGQVSFGKLTLEGRTEHLPLDQPLEVTDLESGSIITARLSDHSVKFLRNTLVTDLIGIHHSIEFLTFASLALECHEGWMVTFLDTLKWMEKEAWNLAIIMGKPEGVVFERLNSAIQNIDTVMEMTGDALINYNELELHSVSHQFAFLIRSKSIFHSMRARWSELEHSAEEWISRLQSRKRKYVSLDPAQHGWTDKKAETYPSILLDSNYRFKYKPIGDSSTSTAISSNSSMLNNSHLFQSLKLLQPSVQPQFSNRRSKHNSVGDSSTSTVISSNSSIMTDSRLFQSFTLSQPSAQVQFGNHGFKYIPVGDSSTSTKISSNSSLLTISRLFQSLTLSQPSAQSQFRNRGFNYIPLGDSSTSTAISSISSMLTNSRLFQSFMLSQPSVRPQFGNRGFKYIPVGDSSTSTAISSNSSVLNDSRLFQSLTLSQPSAQLLFGNRGFKYIPVGDSSTSTAISSISSMLTNGCLFQRLTLSQPPVQPQYGNRGFKYIPVGDSSTSTAISSSSSMLNDSRLFQSLTLLQPSAQPQFDVMAKQETEPAQDVKAGLDLVNVNEQFEIGAHYSQELEDDKTAMEEAIRSWMEIGNADNAIALVNLGVCYQRGIVVQKDEAKALELYLKASDLGSPVAQINVSLCYIHGIGVEAPDLQMAVKYWARARRLKCRTYCSIMGILV